MAASCGRISDAVRTTDEAYERGQMNRGQNMAVAGIGQVESGDESLVARDDGRVGKVPVYHHVGAGRQLVERSRRRDSVSRR